MYIFFSSRGLPTPFFSEQMLPPRYVLGNYLHMARGRVRKKLTVSVRYQGFDISGTSGMSQNPARAIGRLMIPSTMNSLQSLVSSMLRRQEIFKHTIASLESLPLR